MKGAGGGVGGSPGEKVTGGIRETGKEGAEAGEIGVNYTTLCNISQSKSAKRR